MKARPLSHVDDEPKGIAFGQMVLRGPICLLVTPGVQERQERERSSQNKVLIFAPIYRIKIEESLGNGEPLDDQIKLTNEPKIIEKIIPRSLIRQVGSLEYEKMRRASVIAYSELPLAFEDAAESAAGTMLALYLEDLHNLLNMLWLLRDNAGMVDNAFLVSSTKTFSRYCGLEFILANRGIESTAYSLQELRWARGFYHNFYRKGGSAKAEEQGRSKPLDSFRSSEIVHAETSPFARSMFFVSSARSSKHLSVRIANYCSALETLLVSSPAELTFRLSQRVAWLLGDSPKDRYEIFERMKSAYEFRSKAVHGSYVSGKKFANDLIPTSVSCDSLVRNILAVVLVDKTFREYVTGASRKPDEFEKKLLMMTFGDHEQ